MGHRKRPAELCADSRADRHALNSSMLKVPANATPWPTRPPRLSDLRVAIDLWVTGDGTIFPVQIGDNNSRRAGFNHLPRVSEPGLSPFENSYSTELNHKSY